MLPFRVYTPEELRAATRTSPTRSRVWLDAPTTTRRAGRARGTLVTAFQRLFGRRAVGRPAPGTS